MVTGYSVLRIRRQAIRGVWDEESGLLVMAADLVRIAGRLAAILDVLDDRPISVRALAREVGIPPTTAHDYLTALSANGRAELTSRGWTRPSAEVLFADRSAHPNESDDRGERLAE